MTDEEEKYLNIYSFERINTWLRIARIEGLNTSKEAERKYKSIDGYIATKIGRSEKEAKELYKRLNTVREEIDDIYNKYTEKRKKGFGDFKKFYQWYKSQPRTCFYCEIKEDVTKRLFEKRLLKSKKLAWTGKLEIERKDGDEYTEANCVLCCPLCNNAKSDLISSIDFKKYISGGIQKYQEALFKRMNE